MTTPLTRPVKRRSNTIDPRTGRAIVITLEQGGQLIRLRPAGGRTTYTVTIAQVWMMGARNAAADIRKAKELARRERAERRKHGVRS